VENFSIISLLLLSPIVGIFLLWTSPNLYFVRSVALITSLFCLLLSLMLLSGFDQNFHIDGFQFVERIAWIPSLNINYAVGVDGISILFLPLTSLLFFGVIVSSWTGIRTLPRLYYTFLLFLLFGILGVFVAIDTILFLLFWELTLAPIYFLISLWGIGPNRRYAAVKYTLFMLVGGVFLLFGFIILAMNAADGNVPAQLSFDYITLLHSPKSFEIQTTVFFLLLIGFGAKAPIFPFHTWLPTIAMEGPVSIAAIMTGLKLGAYGFIRFMVPLAPDAAMHYHWLLAGLGVVGILYGAIIAMNQSNLRRMLAYSSISHMGLVVLGIASFNIQGIQGSIFQLLNFSIIMGGLFLVTGFLHHRIGSTDTLSLGGVAHSMPLLTSFFLLFGLAGMGVPGTNGFVAEHLILLGALKSHTGAGLAALGCIVLTAAYFVNIYRTAFLGPIRREIVSDSLDLLPRELGLVLIMACLILFTGFYPSSIMDITQQATELWMSRLHQ
jgi:NADH-quinone oxidoreductase subunit M